jgi:hypothetical protein
VRPGPREGLRNGEAPPGLSRLPAGRRLVARSVLRHKGT